MRGGSEKPFTNSLRFLDRSPQWVAAEANYRIAQAYVSLGERGEALSISSRCFRASLRVPGGSSLRSTSNPYAEPALGAALTVGEGKDRKARLRDRLAMVSP